MTELIMEYQEGLGNQMFQYALQKSLEDKGYNVKASWDSYNNNKYNKTFILPYVFQNIKLEEAKKKGEWYFQEMPHQWSVFIPEIFEINTEKSCNIKGFWQTEKYFSNIKEKLVQDFTFNIQDKKILQLETQIKQNQKPIISLHIRRGDYLKFPIYQNICTKIYYDNAINYFKKQLGEDIEIIIFSNDIIWCKENYPNYTYINTTQFENYQDYYDMYLMSCCHHNIIANSSFSWWGAWLNQNKNKIIIAPNKWLNNFSTKDIWCSDWIKIGGNNNE